MDEASAVFGRASILDPGAGIRIGSGGMNVTTKTTMEATGYASTFELVIPPGFDIGAHVLHDAVSLLYVREGQLDVFAFEPVDRTAPDWHQWRSADGKSFFQGGPGSFASVPSGVPHAFANPGDTHTTVLFQSTLPGGHEVYFRELAAIMTDSPGNTDAVVELRRRYGITQLTALNPGSP